MWKKWNNNYNGNRGPYIGHPTLIETTVEEGYLETIPEVDSVKSKRSSGSTTLPELPFRAMPPMHRISQQYAEPSWSQPSTMPDHYRPREQSPPAYYYPDVSPPNSPRISNPDASIEDAPVSPIDSDTPFSSRQSSTKNAFKSRIPQRKASEKTKFDELGGKQKQETRWDAYSGEPTNDNSGQPSTVRPGEREVQPVEYQYPQLKEKTRLILAGLREREAANKAALGRRPLTVSVPDPLDNVVRKEPWRGQSGRTALVDPVQNNPSARIGPLYTQRNIGFSQQSDLTDITESPTHTLRTTASEESIKPVAPLKIATKSRNTSPQSITVHPSPQVFETIQSAPPMYQHPKTLQSPFASPGPVRDTYSPAGLAAGRADSPLNDMAPDTPRTPTPPLPYQNSTPIKVQQMPNESEVSRLSWTTYSTSVGDSPGNTRIIHEESPPPMPPMPQLNFKTATPKLNIKKRPVPENFALSPYQQRDVFPSPVSIVLRKPVPNRSRPSVATIDTVSTELSRSKTLPRIPPELEAGDKITVLEAKLKALEMRKSNTSRIIIRDLSDSLRKNAIVYDIWKRKDLEDKISRHQAELQFITKQEHDIGLHRHRAMRKRDADDLYEQPTGLWVRRVTT